MPSMPSLTMPRQGIVRIGLPDGIGIEFSVDDPPRLRDLVDDDHPSYLGLLAMMRWFKQRGVTFNEFRTTPALRAAYAAATWTFTVSA